VRRALRSILFGVQTRPFVFTVDTTKAGSASTHFVLPLDGSSTYNCTVDWGDGTTSIVTTNSDQDHTYAASGTYTVKITERSVGGFPAIFFNGAANDKLKLMAITQWGGNTWRSMDHAFDGCANLVITATDNGTAKTGAVTSWNHAFYECTGLTSFPLLDFSGATDLTQAWQSCTSLTSFPALDLPACTTLNGAWTLCTAMATFPILTSTSHVTDWSNAWLGCPFTSFPVIDTSAGTLFVGTWSYTGLTAFPVLDQHAGTNLTDMLTGVTISKASYNALLDLLANGNGGSIAKNTNTGVTAGFGGAHYDGIGIPARALLVTTRSWTITDGGTP
jgi:hypothetical protein